MVLQYTRFYPLVYVHSHDDLRPLALPRRTGQIFLIILKSFKYSISKVLIFQHGDFTRYIMLCSMQ